MGTTKHIIRLTNEEKDRLHQIIQSAPPAAAMRARILLGSDFGNPQYQSAPKLAETLGTGHTTVQTVRAEFTKYGLEGAVFPKGRKSYDRCVKMTEEKKVLIRDILKDPPPIDQHRWTVMSICDECVNRGIFKYVAKSAIQKFLHEENIDLKHPNNQ